MMVEGVRVSVIVRVVDVFGCLAWVVMVSEVKENIKKYEIGIWIRMWIWMGETMTVR